MDKIVIGDLEFHDCFVQATPREIAEVDGIIGMDVFSKYLITLDMPARKLRLEPMAAQAMTASLPSQKLSARPLHLGIFCCYRPKSGKKLRGYL